MKNNSPKKLTCSLFILVSCVMLAGAVTAEEPDLTIPTCLNHSEWVYVFNESMSNGLEAFTYDSNHDGHWDIQVMVPQGDTNRYPSLYMYDLNHDGDPDATYIDNLRDGTCGAITLYWAGSRKDLV